MKFPLIMVIIILFLFSFVSADVIDDAITWMYNNELTIYNNQTDFNVDKWLRRDEAAKFFVQFAKLKWKTDYIKTTRQCEFNDINESWSDLKGFVLESCRLWLFQWNKWKFNPQNKITNAEGITVLMRLVDWWQDEQSVKHRSDNYYNRANILNILDNVSINNKNSIATRGNVGIAIYNWDSIKIKDSQVNAPTQREIWLIKKIYKDTNNNYKIDIDYIQYFTWTNAQIEFKKDYPWQDQLMWYYIRNINSKIRTFEIVKGSSVYLKTIIPDLSNFFDLNWWLWEEYSLQEFDIIFKENTNRSSNAIFRIKINNSKIVQIEEEFKP